VHTGGKQSSAFIYLFICLFIHYENCARSTRQNKTKTIKTQTLKRTGKQKRKKESKN